MTIHYPGPYEIRLFYTVTGGTGVIQHEARYNLRVAGDPDPGTPFADIDALRRDDSPFALDGEIDDWIALIDGLYSSNLPMVTFDYCELWKYVPESFDASFVSTYDIGVEGATAAATVSSQQTIVTFRSTLGGIMKLSFMETVITTVARDTLPFDNATLDAVADAVVAGTVPWMARDGGYPFACIAAYPGQNEALFKRRNRS